MSSPSRRRPDPAEGLRVSDEELAQRELERRERMEAVRIEEEDASQREKEWREAPAAESETAPIGPEHLLAEVRKVRQLVGWLVVIIAAQFSWGFGVGLYLSLRDTSDNDTVLGMACAIIAIVFTAASAYLIFRPPSER
jgi:hypothetical protein